MVWREPGQLPPLEITYHFLDVQTHLFCAGPVAGEVWEWLFRVEVEATEARGLLKKSALPALGTPLRAPPRSIGWRSVSCEATWYWRQFSFSYLLHLSIQPMYIWCLYM